jgi:hypothetical protein
MQIKREIGAPAIENTGILLYYNMIENCRISSTKERLFASIYTGEA